MSDGAPDVSLLDGAFYSDDPCPAFACPATFVSGIESMPVTFTPEHV